jgi:hypothetical protein
MAAPDFFDRIIEPPRNDSTPEDTYRWFYDMWQRTGGYETYVVNLNGLEASVQELNTLVGIDTNTTVQAQLDTKLTNADIGTIAAQDADNVNITGGNLEDVVIDNSTVSGDISNQMGGSTTYASCGVSAHTDITQVANTNGSENDLMIYELEADSLIAEGDYVDLEMWGTFAANANNKRLRVYFGSDLIYDTGAVAANAGSWYFKAKVMASSTGAQKSITNLISSNALLPASNQVADTTQDATAVIEIKTTATAVAANDIVQKGFSVKWFSAA